MSNHTAPAAQTEELPIRQPRGLLITVIVLGVLLVVGFVVVFATIAYRVAGEGTSAPAVKAGFERSIELKADQSVKNVFSSEGRLVVYLTGGGADEIVLIDPRRGEETGRIKLTPSAP